MSSAVGNTDNGILERIVCPPLSVQCMVDLIPVLLFVFGLIALTKPDWVAAIDRRQKAAGTTRSPGDVKISETYYAVVRLAGIGFTLFGLLFIIRSW